MQVYRDQAAPVEDAFRQAGVLHDFEITAGIPETMPGLLATLQPYIERGQGSAQKAAAGR